MHHTVWTVKDGLPAGRGMMAQTRDGYLWFGSFAGLTRFDGQRFEPYTPASGSVPRGDVSFLLAAPDGGLWVGWALGGVSLLQHGVLRNFGVADGVPAGSTKGMVFDRQGQLWITTAKGVATYDGKQWTSIGQAQGLPALGGSTPFIAQDGSVALFAAEGVFVRPAGAARFLPASGHGRLWGAPLQLPDGTLYSTENRGVRQIASLARYDQPDHSWLYRQHPEAVSTMAQDRHGALWFISYAGVHRRSAPATPDGALSSYTKADGLSGTVVTYLMVDRDDNVWVWTNGGLDRFRPVDVRPLQGASTTVDLQNRQMLPGADASMWLANYLGVDAWLNARPDGTLKVLQAEGQVTAVLQGRDGTVWRAGADLLRAYRPGGRVEQIAYPALAPRNGNIFAMAEAPDGAVWVSILGTGVFRYANGAWSSDARLPGKGRSAALSLMNDSAGRLWFGYPHHKVAMLAGDQLSVYTDKEGLGVDWAATWAEHQGRVWLAGSDALAYFKDGRFVTLHTARPEALRTVSGMVATANGDLWLNGAAGLVQLPAAQLQRALADSGYAMQARIFDADDGYPGQTSVLNRRTLALASDGKLWASNNTGTYWIAPDSLLAPAPPPQALLQAVTANGERHAEPAALALPIGLENLHFDYTATDLGAPERTRFRYRLDGYDQQWQEVGARRQAFYTKVGPGHYVFRVNAASGDGAWNDSGASIAFSIAPAYYQTGWFRALVLLATALALYALHAWRLRRVARRSGELVRATLDERARIARALHDSFLQNVMALVLRFDAVRRRLPDDGAARGQMETILGEADRVLLDVRQQVFDLRSGAAANADLAPSLARLGEALQAMYQVPFTLQLAGAAVPLANAALDDLFQIGREALTNAFRHAGASNVGVTLACQRGAFTLQVRDDGSGLPAGMVPAEGSPGHWGLIGMHERAARLGATLHFASSAAGTRITLTVPAAVAYARPSARARLAHWWRRRTTPTSNRSALHLPTQQ